MEYKGDCCIKANNLKKGKYKSFVIGADIGATKSNIAVFGVNKKLELIFHYKFYSSSLKGIIEPLKVVLDYTRKEYKIKISNCCLAVAGPIVNGVNKKLTNQPWGVNPKEVIKKTSLKKVRLLNDFEAIGYGIELLEEKDLIELKKGKQIKNATRALIGAGTGLGEGILKFENDSYIPMPSEGGHTDFAQYNKEEFKLAEFLKEKVTKGKPIDYEEVLSGRGLLNLYNFYRKLSKITRLIDKASIKEKPPLISKNSNKDPACKKAMELFIRFYARASKNLALTTLPLGGLYIGGGIAPYIISQLKNSDFTKEFTNIAPPDLRKLLQQIPVYIIKRYDVSVYGAANVARKL